MKLQRRNALAAGLSVFGAWLAGKGHASPLDLTKPPKGGSASAPQTLKPYDSLAEGYWAALSAVDVKPGTLVQIQVSPETSAQRCMAIADEIGAWVEDRGGKLVLVPTSPVTEMPFGDAVEACTLLEETMPHLLAAPVPFTKKDGSTQYWLVPIEGREGLAARIDRFLNRCGK